MISRVKYRVIGIVVVLALIIIIVPSFFKHHRAFEPVKTAATPVLATHQLPQKAQPVRVTPASAKLKQAVPPLKAYTIQVASFKDPAHVKRLVDRLTAKHFKAYSHRPANSSYTAVFVGPVLKKSEAKQLLAQLHSTFRLSGFIKRYQPVQS